jgi:hypothetical protein
VATADLWSAERLLREGRFDEIELIPWGSNYTFACRLAGPNGEQTIGIYKPQRGEQPLSDFPGGTLYRREVAAYRLAQALEWDLVPLTIVREDGPHGVGSLQRFVQTVEEPPEEQYYRIQVEQSQQLQRMALFDVLTNNADRKGGHCLLDPSGHVWGIDHGLTFNSWPKLRTIVWDFAEQLVPPDLIGRVAELREDGAAFGQLQLELAELIDDEEREALVARWDALLLNPSFPKPGSYRSVPWPMY